MSLEEIARGVHTQIKAETGENKVAVALIVMTQGDEPDSDSLAAHSVGFEDQIGLGSTLAIIGQQMLQAQGLGDIDQNRIIDASDDEVLAEFIEGEENA